MDEWIKKMRYIYTVEFSSAIEKNKIMLGMVANILMPRRSRRIKEEEEEEEKEEEGKKQKRRRGNRS
jgi:hypothetical protein